MKPDVVVDIGNTRLKMGLVDPARSVLVATESLPDEVGEWHKRLDTWQRNRPLQWVVASVNPGRTDRLRGWVEARGDHFFHLHSASQLPLAVGLEHPDR